MAKNTVSRDEEGMQRSKTELTIRLLKYLSPYKLKATIVIILLLFVMICGIINPYLLKIAIDSYIGDSNIKGLMYIGALLLTLNILSMIASKIRIVMMSSITNNILVNIRHELYTHIQKLSFSFFDNRPVGKILARVMGDVNALQNLFNQSIQTLIPELMSLVCVSIMMLFLNFKLALAAIAILPFLAVAMFFIEIQSRKRWEVYRKKRSNLNAYNHEDFSGIKVVQAFAKEGDTLSKFKDLVNELVNSFVAAVKFNDFFWPLVELSWGVGIVIVFYVGYLLVKSNDVTIGTLVAFSMYIGMFWRPIMNLSTFYNTLITNFSAADRIFDIMEIEPDIISAIDSIKIPKIKGSVEFKDVTFAYDEGSVVLNNVNFKVTPGETVALVGATGAGKTTIVSLLSRFYDPTSGEVLVDGKNIKNVELESYRSQMGIMLQDTFLFSTTIKENIRYGKLDATDEEVIAAAKAVNAHGFIMNMEKGYDTEVNERGSRLSLGQRQLISFARALLANPRILILDEATSNIDTHTEKLVQKGIEKLLFGRTSFVIAHRLSTIRDCDKIMVVGDGNIKESGTHDELLALKGIYYNLYNAQYKFLNEGA
ncbi:ABC transporter ATP-binding protein [Clostridium folliculivorans]|uniref:Multidrug ABC transporter ATP-binding protein n=1 Tax=Clostridium folliculivorans TaxID=2886038 RepID=A0A9W5Y3K9_9CLOT|nr:ABC transporter ATP-binding protein [Clostridium folliculivorans]GKU26121.1 multidrug ABC transporter ATP-binding protein [Clostridium folliculivorans]GKU28207.1 multidrug ABC transporter ATP-binding protein [Clostridium folliculivorans]